MNMNRDFLKSFIQVAIIVSILDFLWIGGFLLDHIKPMIERIQGEPMVTNPFSVIMAYLILFALITITTAKSDSILEAFIIGFLTYAVYDSTNFATFKQWDLPLAIVDSLWGGFLFASVFYILRT